MYEMVFPPTLLGDSEKLDIGMVSAINFFNDLASMNVKGEKFDGGNRVLVVEGDQDFRRYITDCIEAEGISCITATSVSEALEALRRNKVSVLLVDWFLDRCRTTINVLGDMNVSCLLDGKSRMEALPTEEEPALSDPAPQPGAGAPAVASEL